MVRLTDNDTIDTNPDWSPDRSRIAFTSNRDGDLDIWLMRADGTGVVPLTRNDVPDSEVDWSPDGSHLTYDSFDDAGVLQVFTVDSEGTGPRSSSQP